jgi:hypothetical protein
VGEKLSEVYLGPYVGGGIEIWFAYVLALGSCCSVRRACSARRSLTASEEEEHHVLQRKRPVQDLLPADQQIFPILQDRWAVFCCWSGGLSSLVPMLAERLPVARHPDSVPDPFAGRRGREHPGRLLRADLAGLGRLHGRGRLRAYNFFVRIDGMPLIVALMLGGVCAMLFGMLFGMPSLRVRGLYLAVATLAAQFFCDWMFLRIKWFTWTRPSGLGGGVQPAGVWAAD